MGEGLKRVAKQCGGLIIKAKGQTVAYDKHGKMKSKTIDEITGNPPGTFQQFLKDEEAKEKADFVCDVCGLFQKAGELGNESNGERLICISCQWQEKDKPQIKPPRNSIRKLGMMPPMLRQRMMIELTQRFWIDEAKRRKRIVQF